MIRYFIIISIFFAMGCGSEIGDSCSYDADCSPEGDRICDNSKPGGYCLIISCSPDQCPGEASCIEFTTPNPDFENNDENSSLYDTMAANRTRTYCMKSCKKNSDCRSSYYCALPEDLKEDFNASIIDTSSIQGVCLPNQK